MLTGMWEVFALAGLRAVLVFYLTQDLAYTPAAAVQIYSLSTAAAMAMSLVGGVIADRVIGVRRAIAYGAIGMALGHLLIVVPSLLFPALLLVTLANGLFKPSLVAQMNRLYQPNDPYRDRAFTVYKAGVNGAAIFAPIITGLVGQRYGWAAALAVCGIGMVIACVTFWFGRRYLIEAYTAPAIVGDASHAASRGAVFGQLALVLLGAVLFWTAHGQQGGTIALWAESAVDRATSFFGEPFEIPAAWFQSVNPIIIVCCTPIINALWARRESSELRRMTVGALFLMMSLVIVALASELAGERPVSSAWLFGALFLLTLGELYFDALGQAFVLRLASAKTMTTFVSLWFLTIAGGFAAAGWLAQIWGLIETPLYFMLAAALAAAAAALVFVARMQSERRQ